MAQRMQILYTDDLDGSPAGGTVRFGIDGASYEIDLSKKHADQFAEALAPYIAVARRLSPARRAAPPPRAARHDQSDVRAWARGQGLKVSDRGRIPADVLASYQSAR